MDLEGSGNHGAGANMLHFPSPTNNDDNRLLNQQQFHQQQPFGMDPRGHQTRLVDNFITIRVFLKVHDDQKNEHLKKLFLNTTANTEIIPDTNHLNQTESLTDHPVNFNGEDQVYIDIEIQQHLNCADLIVRAIDWFNEHLKDRKTNLILEDSDLNFYELFMAKKTGKPNDDFPNIEKSQIVSKINYNRFALCVKQQAIVPSPAFMAQSYQTQVQRDPKKQSMLLGNLSGQNAAAGANMSYNTGVHQTGSNSNLNMYQMSGDLPSNGRMSGGENHSSRKPIAAESRSCQQCCTIF
eukprot:403345659